MMLAMGCGFSHANPVLIRQDFDNTTTFTPNTIIDGNTFGSGTTTDGVWSDLLAFGSGSAITNGNSHSPGQSIWFTRDFGIGFPQGRRTDVSINIQNDAAFEYGFWLYRTTSDASVFINVNRFDKTAFVEPLVMIVAPGGELTLRNATDTAYTSASTPTFLPVGQWVEILRNVDLRSQTVETFYNSGSGRVSIDVRGFSTNNLFNTDAILFAAQNPSGGNAMFFDDVFLALPEPSTAMLLIAGGLLLRRFPRNG
jgi:hypothetical protein